MMIITPLPSCFFWPGILLPAVVIELLAGSAKFLFFDTQICHSALWVPSGEDPLYQRAESCTLMIDAIISIVSSFVSLVCVLMICLRAPKRRNLDDDFGMRYKDVDNDMLGLRADTMEDSIFRNTNDEESQELERKKHPWSPRKAHATQAQVLKVTKSYDLEEIVQKQMQVDDFAKKKPKKRNSSRQTKKVSKDEWAPEKLRTVEASFEHANKDLKEVWDASAATKFAEDSKNMASSSKAQTPVSASDEQPMKNKKSHTRAPSDEGGCGFRSPLKAFKDNFSPQKGKMKNSMTNKIIQKALDDLVSSFAGPSQVRVDP